MNEIGDIVIPESFDAISAADIRRVEQVLGALWSSTDPTVDVRTGALLSLVLRPFASLLSASMESFRLAGRQSSLSYLTSADAVYESADLLDAVARNYHIVRKVGTAAHGVLRLVFSQQITVSIGPMDSFALHDIEFRPLRQYTADVREAYAGSGLKFYPMPDASGNVYFDLPVYAVTNGVSGNVTKGTRVSLVRQNVPFFLDAFAVDTFTGGSDDESNHALIQRMVYGLSAKVLSSRTNMQASLLEVFPDIRDSSIIGAGDEEMTRDKHTVFPGSTGGYVDWYIASTRQLQTATYEFEHFQRINDVSEETPLYNLALLEEHFPGLYWVSEILDADTNKPCEVIAQQKHAAEGDVNSPRVYDDQEAMFTAYQETSLQFSGPPELVRIKVSGTCMPLIKEIQDWVLRCGQSPIGLDVLVKGAVPVTVKFSASLYTPSGAEVDFTALQNKVADYINGFPFGGVLAVSGLVALLHASLPEGSYVSDTSLVSLQWLSDTPVAYYSRDRLTLDFLPFGTNKTSICYCDPADIVFTHKFLETIC